MSISSRELKAGFFFEDPLENPVQGFDFTGEETHWTIVKYVVRNGDTINALSQRFKIPTLLISRLNALYPDATLKQGQVILLPELY
ncbi:MAG TPA: LysM peptidoglycan-binding domain-containing protein [Bacillota bacterium]